MTERVLYGDRRPFDTYEDQTKKICDREAFTNVSTDIKLLKPTIATEAKNTEQSKDVNLILPLLNVPCSD